MCCIPRKSSNSGKKIKYLYLPNCKYYIKIINTDIDEVLILITN